MKAAVYRRYGPPEVLRLAEVAKPTPKDNELLIEIHATTVSAADYRVRSFTVPRSFWLPARLALGLTRPKRTILGAELAGEVVAVGKAVTRFAPGDQVFGDALPHFGAYARYICLPEDGKVALKPSTLSFAEAAAVPIGGRTALHYLRQAGVRPGQKVLIYGASGSVGSYAVQLAKHFGAHVTGVCSGANAVLVASLGADEVIDYTQEDFARNGQTYDVVFMAVDKRTFASCAASLKKGGTYIDITAPLPDARLLWASLTRGQKFLLGQSMTDDAAGLTELAKLIDAGVLTPVIDRRYPLERIVEAHRYAGQGHKKGNVVITVGSLAERARSFDRNDETINNKTARNETGALS